MGRGGRGTATSSSSGRRARRRSTSGTSSSRSTAARSTRGCWWVTLPHSNAQFLVALPCERAEVFCQARGPSSSESGACRACSCSTTPPRRAGWCSARLRSPGSSPSFGLATAVRAATATPAWGTRMGRWRTPWTSYGAASSSRSQRWPRWTSPTRGSHPAATAPTPAQGTGRAGDYGDAPGGPRGHAGAARYAVRRGQVGACPRRQARLRARVRQPLLHPCIPLA